MHQVQSFLEDNSEVSVLIVMDGLERIQEDRAGSALGELNDMPLRQLLRRLAEGVGGLVPLSLAATPLRIWRTGEIKDISK